MDQASVLDPASSLGHVSLAAVPCDRLLRLWGWPDYFAVIKLVREAGRPTVLGFCGKIAATALPSAKAQVLDSKGRRASIANSVRGPGIDSGSPRPVILAWRC